LTREHWKSFEKPDGRFDGLAFERLVSFLLPLLYPGKWIRTQYSWDGKRDFYQQAGSELRWAECKAYKEPISINVVSPTLIMALIEEAHVILLFSYSPVNRNAQWYLSQFAASTSRTIRVFDDEALEELILSCPETRAFFSAPPIIQPPSRSAITVEARLSQDPEIEYNRIAPFHQDPQEIYLSLLSTFSLDVLVRNGGQGEAVVGHIRLGEQDLGERFWLFNRDLPEANPVVPFSIEPGGSFFYRFYIRSRRAGVQNAPRVTVETKGQPPESPPLERINVSAILAVPLIGSQPNRLLGQFRHLVSGREKPTFMHIYGESGTGKSRLLREFRDELLGRGYAVFMFNGEDERNSSFDYFVRRLTSAICKLPMLDHVARPSGAGEGFAAPGADPGLLDLLYCESARPSMDPASSTRTILSVLTARKAAVIVDNMQFFERDVIGLFNRAITDTLETPARNVWVLALNTELATSEMPATGLSTRLRGLSADNPGSVIAVKLDGFSQNDSRLYLDEALAGEVSRPAAKFTMTHPKTAALIVQRVGTRPLFLEQALQHAADRGGLALSDGRLYVSDIGLFHSAIRVLPDRIRELIAMRWRFLAERLPAGATKLIKSLAGLISMPMAIVRALDIGNSAVEELDRLGLVRITESNDVQFHHRQHYLYFCEFYREVSAAFACELLQAIAAAGYSASFPFQEVALRDAAGVLEDRDVQRIARIILENEVVGPARQRAAPLLVAIFNRPDVPVEPEMELRVTSAVCEDIKRHNSFEEAARAYDYAQSAQATRPFRYLGCGEARFDFVHNHANSCYALHRDLQALGLLESALPQLARYAFRMEAARLVARGKLLNRLCVALKTIHDLDGAERSVRESLKIAEDLGDVRLQYKNYVDWGYVFHGFYRHNAALVEKWGQALQVLDASAASGSPIEQEHASALLHRGALAILQKRRDSAVAVIEEGIRVSQRVLSPFHEVKLLLLRVVAELAWTGEADPNDLMHWVDRAEDCSIAAHADRSYWAVFYTRAKLHLMKKDNRQAAEAFLTALGQISKILTDPRMEERYEPFFEDLAISTRLMGRRLSGPSLGLISNARIRSMVERLLECPATVFDDWLSSYRPTATYHDGRYNLPVP
jgi:tetratricopeptide (TPR) repeat protein